MEFFMHKALMIVSLTAFAVTAAFAAPRNSDVTETSPTNDEVVILPIDDQTPDSAKTVDEKDCGCHKPKKGRK
jgi:hypothetical protein